VVEAEINYLDEKEKKAEMLMEADKQNDTETEKVDGEKGAKPELVNGKRDDQYFSEILFKDLNLSE